MITNICYESTSDCNLSCDYCISSDNLGLKEINYSKIIECIQKISPRRIVISGGEPFLDNNLVDKVKKLKTKENYVSISTNGTINNLYKQVLPYTDCLDFSLPAIDEQIYKEMRGLSVSQSVQNNIIEAVKMGFNVRISFILTNINKSELFKILTFGEEAKVNSLRIGRYFPYRNAFNIRDKYELEYSEIETLISTINEETYSYRLMYPINPLNLMETGYLIIDKAGNIFFSTTSGKNKIGNVSNFDIKKLKEIESTQDKIFKNNEYK